ncbi:MAG: DNA repair protein RecO [Candidatus Paceibacterota bacterium]
MSHQTYTTKALVCGAYDHNTSDKSFQLFTREAGMLFATARSVREERSKQRPALQEFSLIKVSLVKGKQGWRIGSVEPEVNYFMLASDRLARASVVRLVKILRRFIHGEESSPQLFDFFIESIEKISRECEDRQYVELIIELKILAMLGYVDSKSFSISLDKSDFNNLSLYKEKLSLAQLEYLIKKAVENSHL